MWIRPLLPLPMAGKRWSPDWPEPKIPPGGMAGEVRDQEIHTRLAKICVGWPHIEEAMISVLSKLLSETASIESHELARPIFRAIIAPAARISVMRTLLQHARVNRNKGEDYDRVLKAFSDASLTRNRYIHGLWWTHQDGGTFLQATSVDGMAWLQAERVTIAELDNYIQELGELHRLIHFTILP